MVVNVLPRPGASNFRHIDWILEFFPGRIASRLEPLKADREGQYSIRINNQFRLCFIWTGSDAEEVEIVDYH